MVDSKYYKITNGFLIYVDVCYYEERILLWAQNKQGGFTLGKQKKLLRGSNLNQVLKSE